VVDIVLIVLITRPTSVVPYPQLILFSNVLPPRSSPAVDCSVIVVSAVVVVAAVRFIATAIVVRVDVVLKPLVKYILFYYSTIVRIE
jgi:hypothetical protein